MWIHGSGLKKYLLNEPRFDVLNFSRRKGLLVGLLPLHASGGRAQKLLHIFSCVLVFIQFLDGYLDAFCKYKEALYMSVKIPSRCCSSSFQRTRYQNVGLSQSYKQMMYLSDWPGEADELDCSALESSSVLQPEAGENSLKNCRVISI